MSSRTFVVTVSESPARVIVEDVRNRRRAVAADLPDVGEQIVRLLEEIPQRDPDRRGSEKRETRQST